MNADQLMIFGGRRLYCLTGPDVKKAQAALAEGDVEGLMVSRHRGFVGADLTILDSFEGLRTLVIADAADIDISAVQNIDTLRYLSLGEVRGRLDLSRFANLEHLRFTASKDIALPQSGLERLRELAIWSFPEEDLSILSGYAGLLALELIQAKKLSSLAGVQCCRALSKLVVAYSPALRDINALSDLKELSDLDFESVKKIETYSSLAALIGIERLIIDKAAPMGDLEFCDPW
jgi:hypothetical protein